MNINVAFVEGLMLINVEQINQIPNTIYTYGLWIMGMARYGIAYQSIDQTIFQLPITHHAYNVPVKLKRFIANAIYLFIFFCFHQK